MQQENKTPVQRLLQLEQLVAQILMPTIAQLEHNNYVNGKVIGLLMAGRPPTQLQWNVFNNEAAAYIARKYPYLTPIKQHPDIITKGGM